MTWKHRRRNYCREQDCHTAQVYMVDFNKEEALIILSSSEGGWHGGISQRRWYLHWVLREGKGEQLRQKQARMWKCHEMVSVMATWSMWVNSCTLAKLQVKTRSWEYVPHAKSLNCIPPLVRNQERKRWIESESLDSHPSVTDYLQPWASHPSCLSLSIHKLKVGTISTSWIEVTIAHELQSAIQV